MPSHRVAALLLAACAAVPVGPAAAQLVRTTAHDHLGATVVHRDGLRGRISELFIFGPGQDPLFLGGSAGSTDARAHGTHFIPSSAASNGAVITFITQALGNSVASVPIGATTSGETFRFEGGVPVSTSTSSGPIFAERAQTLGRHRVLAGANRSSFSFNSLRGVRLRDVKLNFTHQNVTEADDPGCGQRNNGDCKAMGVPVLENDVMAVRLNLDIAVAVTSFYLTYGVTDRADFGVVLPVLQNSIHGSSDAQILPFGGPTAVHFFAGTTQSPVLNANRSSSGSAFGLGDVAARLKINAVNTPRAGLAFLFDARLPTGDVDNFMGTGEFAGRALVVASSRLGTFSPHLNAGYVYRAGHDQNDAVLATAGFDQLISSRVTFAADVLSELQVGGNSLTLPGPVSYDLPFRRTVDPTNIPDLRDDIVNGSLGFKFSTANRITGVANALFPLNDGGLRAQLTWTLGVEYSF